MDIIKPRIVLCILHDQPSVIENACSKLDSFDYDREYSDCGFDERMQDAFDYSWDRVAPSATEEDMESVCKHANVAYSVSLPLSKDISLDVAAECLALVAESFSLGARAIKCESSGVAHGKSRWMELAGQESDERFYYALTRRPLADESIVYSCGLHLLGLPDVEVEGFDNWEATRIIDAFALYMLLEKSANSIKEGHTFSCTPNDSALRIQHSSCRRYEEDDFFFNPYGYWNLKKIEH